MTNWNYNSFSVYLLANAYRVTHEAKYLEAAKEKARLGVLPGQLQEGQYKGRWADQHNARPAYHYIMIRGLTSLWAVLPADDAELEPIASTIRTAMQTRNAEFVSQGVMNVDSALEALLLFKSLPAEKQQAVGVCDVDEALGVLERHCVARLRKNQGPFSPASAEDTSSMSSVAVHNLKTSCKHEASQTTLVCSLWFGRPRDDGGACRRADDYLAVAAHTRSLHRGDPIGRLWPCGTRSHSKIFQTR